MGYQFVFEEERCTGCYTCHTACMNAHYDTDVKGRSFRAIRQVTSESEGYQKNVCPGCTHCGECIKSCKSHALYRDTCTGFVLSDREKCVGCKACEKVCPMQVIRFDHVPKALKCDGCIGLLKAGREPACVKNCPVKAMKIEKR